VCGKVIPSMTTTTEGKKKINAPFFPFCSDRCRVLDLGAWLNEKYAFPLQPDTDPESEEEGDE
jgi:endogenous inhibitor of DNA gyrase (YacG/DUF329 family)